VFITKEEAVKKKFFKAHTQYSEPTYIVLSSPLSSSSSSLSYDRSIASFKELSPQRAIYGFLFQLLAYSYFLIQKLLASSSPSSRHFYHSLFLSLNNLFQKAVPTQDVTNPVILPSIYCMYDISVLLKVIQ